MCGSVGEYISLELFYNVKMFAKTVLPHQHNHGHYTDTTLFMRIENSFLVRK